MSLLDVPLLRQQPDEKPSLLRLFSLTKSLGDRDTDLQLAAEEHNDHELTVGNLISHDGKSVNVLAFLDWSDLTQQGHDEANRRRTALVKGVLQVAEKWNRQLDEPVRLSGIPIIQITLYKNMRHDLIVFGLASLALFTLSFFLVYRHPRLVMLPIICCLLPPVVVLGGMGWLGIPIGFVTSNMPVLLFVLVLPYTVYFIESYRERRMQQPEEKGLASTLEALKAILVPCLFSVSTTLAGLMALAASKIIPIQDFGKTMTSGMIVGFVIVFLTLALISRRLPGLTFTPRSPSKGETLPTLGIVRLFRNWSLKRAPWVLGVSLAVLVIAVLGVRQISAESKFTSYFWPSSDVNQGLEYIDQKMGGTTWLEIILRSDEEAFFRSDEGLQAQELAEAYFDDIPETGNILSLVSLRNEMRKTFKSAWFPNISDSALLQAVNFMAADLVKQTTSQDFKTTRITVRMKETADSLNRSAILAGLREHLAAHDEVFGDLKVQITGVFPVYTEMLEQLITGQRDSIRFVAIAVYLMLLILFRSPVLALIVLIPQALPVTVVLGVIGYAGIPLDLVTVMIGSIAIGVGIDAAIQYTMRFRKELERCGDHRAALTAAHGTIGRAIWIATTIIISGFGILVLSDFFPSVWFGLFTALAMLISQLATLTVLPALFLLTGYPKIRPQSSEGQASSTPSLSSSA